MPDATIVGGPNGAGKSTFARELVQTRGLRYLGADRIAKEIRPDAPEEASIQAGRVFIQRLRAAIDDRQDLVVESTLAGRGLRRYLDRMQEAGYSVRVVFIFLETPEQCVRRVRQRVKKGGHHVPREDVVRRFRRSIQNFWTVYRTRADQWALFFNGDDRFYDVASGSQLSTTVRDESLFDLFFSHLSSEDDG
jgi:predicted ABC-type ATPase